MEHKFIRQPHLEGKGIGKEEEELPDSCVLESRCVRFKMATADIEYFEDVEATFISSQEHEFDCEMLCGSRKK